MIVVDTSAFVTIASVDVLEAVLREYDVHTTERVIQELEETAAYEDVHARAAQDVLDHVGQLSVHDTGGAGYQSSRIDDGEGTAVTLANETGADFTITDDLRALPELQTVADASVVISPIVLKALVKRGVLEREDALQKVEEAAENRDWLESPIYSKAKDLFE